MGRGPCVVLVLVLLSLTCEFQSVNAAVVQGSSNSSQLREQFLSNYKKAYRSAADLFPPSVVKIMESVVDKVAQGAQESFSPGSRESFSKMISETRGGIGSGKIRIAPILRSLLGTNEMENSDNHAQTDTLALLQTSISEPFDLGARTGADVGVMFMMIVVFLLLFGVPMGFEVTQLMKLQTCLISEYTELASKQIAKTHHLEMKQVEFTTAESLPVISSGYWVSLTAEGTPVKPPISRHPKPGQTNLKIYPEIKIELPPQNSKPATDHLGFLITGIDYKDSPIESYLRPGDIIIGVNCDLVKLREVALDGLTSRDVDPINAMMSDKHSETLVLTTIHPSCVTREAFNPMVNKKPTLIRAHLVDCPDGALDDIVSVSRMFYGQSTRNEYFKIVSLLEEQSEARGVGYAPSALGPELSRIFFACIFGIALLLGWMTLAGQFNHIENKRLKFRWFARYVFLPATILFCLLFPHAVSMYRSEVSELSKWYIGFTVVVIFSSVLLTAGSLYRVFGGREKEPEKSEFAHRPIEINRAILLGVPMLASFLVALGFLFGRSRSDNASIRSTRIAAMSMSYVSAMLSVVSFLQSTIAVVGSGFGVPAFPFFPKSSWDIIVSFVSVATTFGSFWEDSRNLNANGPVCNIAHLREKLDSTHISFDLQCQGFANNKADVPCGEWCWVLCANGYEFTANCYDYGLIGGVWSQEKEEQLDATKAACSLIQGCQISQLPAASTNCPTTGMVPASTVCSTSQGSSRCSLVFADGTWVARWKNTGCVNC